MARGTGASAGIGIGKAAILREEKLVIENTGIEDAEAEKERFKSAVEQSIADVSALRMTWHPESERKKLRF